MLTPPFPPSPHPRLYTINLHKRLHKITFKNRAPRAIREIKKFAEKNMGTKCVLFFVCLFIYLRLCSILYVGVGGWMEGVLGCWGSICLSLIFIGCVVVTPTPRNKSMGAHQRR